VSSHGTVPAVAPLSYADLERFAERLVERHYPELLEQPGAFPIQEFFEFTLEPTYGVVAGVSSRLPANVEGITLPGSRAALPQTLIAPAVYEGMAGGIGRARFTGAHEAGHALLHAKQIRTMLISGTLGGLHRRSNIQPCANPEWQANAFAGALLMNAPAVRAAIQKLAVFQVSYSALGIRLSKLKRWGKI
jgi:hypothetical protein